MAMESSRFDDLIKAVSATTSRRKALKAALGVLLTRLEGVAGAEAARPRRGRSVTAEACIPTGKPCPASKPRGRKGHGKEGKTPKKLTCNDCCQRLVTTNANGQQVCACVPHGQPCTGAWECCNGICTDGVCLTPSSPPPPPPPPGPVCRGDGQTCTDPAQCCTAVCNGGVCGRP